MRKYLFAIFAIFALALLPQSFASGCGTPPSSLIISCIPVNVVNTQSAATPSGFQMMFNALPFNALSGNWIFYNSTSGRPLNAWAENSSVIWVNLGANTIAASSSVNGIYVFGLGGATTNFFIGGNDIGEAPQLSPSYAEYDNGNSVFNFYDNFAGTVLNAAKWGSPSGATATVNNGLTLVGTTSAMGTLESTYTISATDVLEIYAAAIGSSSDLGISPYSSGQQGFMICVTCSGTGLSRVNLYSGQASGTGTPTSGAYYLLSGYQGNTAGAYATTNYGMLVTTTQAPITGTPLDLNIYSTSSTGVFQWTRTRVYPPSGVMPSVSYGAVLLAIHINISPNPATYGQAITLTATCGLSTDSCAIDYPSLGTHIATGTGSATYTYPAFALPLGTYSSFYANDITQNTNSSGATLTIYVPIYLENITAGSSVQATKTITPNISPYTWNTYYPNEISITSPNSMLNYTLAQNFDANAIQYLTLNAPSLAYIPPSNQITGNYLYTVIERQSGDTRHLNLTIAANVLNMTDIANAMTFNSYSSGCIQYLPCLASFPANNFTVKPASWQIKSDVLTNTHSNTSAGEQFSNANLTVPFLGVNGLLTLTYSQFSPAYTFEPNAINNPKQQANVLQTAFKVVASNTIPAAPNTREITNISFYNEHTDAPLATNATMFSSYNINNYTLGNLSKSTNTNSIQLYIPHSTYQNPRLYMFNTSIVASSPTSYFDAVDSYCPAYVDTGSYRNFDIYQVDSSGSLYTFSVYRGYSPIPAGVYMEVYSGISLSTAIGVQSFLITSNPYSVPLENGAPYAFKFFNCTSTVYQTNFSVWGNPITLYLPQNMTTPKYVIPSPNVTCVTLPYEGNNMIHCTGTDTSHYVSKWKLYVYNVSSILTQSLIAENTINSDTFIYNFSPAYAGVQYHVVGVAVVGNVLDPEYTALNYYTGKALSYIPKILANGWIALLMVFGAIAIGSRSYPLAIIYLIAFLFVSDILTIVPMLTSLIYFLIAFGAFVIYIGVKRMIY